MKGKSTEECQNYIKVLQQYQDNPDRFLVCGTNAYKPSCRVYVDERGSYDMRDDIRGLGLAPFSPWHNSTAVLVEEHLYAGNILVIKLPNMAEYIRVQFLYEICLSAQIRKHLNFLLSCVANLYDN